MRRYLLVLILAALVAQPAFADPQDKGERGRGEGRGKPAREETRSRPGRGPEGRGNGPARQEVRGQERPGRQDMRVREQERPGRQDMRVREQGPPPARGDVRFREPAPARPDVRFRESGPPQRDVRFRDSGPRPIVRERDMRVRQDVRYRDAGPRGNAYGRGPYAPGMRVGQRGHWVRGPMPGPAVGMRGRVYVSPGFPIRRPLPYVFVRRHPVYWGHLYFGPTFFFAPRIVVLPAPDRLVWEDSQVLYEDDDWTDFTLDVNDYGGALYLEITDPTQIDWCEVVFSDGYTRVVDFDRDVVRPGVYTLLDFAGRRDVQFVRVVARAMEPRARISVSMARY